MFVTLIRHGETDYIIDKAKIDVRNVSLTPFGCLQSSLLIGRYDCVIISPLLRTVMTHENSQIVSPLVLYDPNIREYKTCICDFMADEEILFETENDIVARCLKFYNYLRTSFINKKICIITHANWIKYFTQVIGQPLDHYPTNCEMLNLTI
jgi:broad specificity phosphatase PhoE